MQFFSDMRSPTALSLRIPSQGYCRQRTTDELIEEIDALAPSAYMNKDKAMLGTAGMAVAGDVVPAASTATLDE